MAVFPDRIILKHSADSDANIRAAIAVGATDEILPGEIVVRTAANGVTFYTIDDAGNIVTLGTSQVASSAICLTSNTPPTEDINGNPLTNGHMWFDYSDDTYHVYYNNAWIEVAGGGTGGIEEAPQDGQQYARQNAGWTVVEATGGGDAVTSWSVTANGTSSYVFAGDGFAGNETNPVLYVVRGQTYKITNSMGAHPFMIQSTPGIGGAVYTDGITGNGVNNGTLTWEVRLDAPSELFYQCGAHADMNGTIQVLENGSGGGAISLDDLTDVDTSSPGHVPADGEALVWSESMGQWVPGAVNGGETPVVAGWTMDSDSTAATSKTLDAPTHSEGDLLVACIMSRESGGALTPPAGWALYGSYLSNISYGSDVQTISVFSKTATNSEPVNYTWTQANSSRICGFIASVEGTSGIASVTEFYGNATTANFETSGGVLNITAATWVYTLVGSSESYSQSGPGLTEITDSPMAQARMSGGHTTSAGFGTSTHAGDAVDDNPNHGVIVVKLGSPSGVESVNGQTGVVSLGIQDMDDFALNPAPSFTYFRWASVSTSATVANYDEPGEAAVFANNGGERCIANHTDSDGRDFEAPAVAAVAANGGNALGITIYASRDGGSNWTTHTTTVASTNYSVGTVFLQALTPELDATTDELRLSFDDPSLPPTPLVDGDILQWVAGDNKFKPIQVSTPRATSSAVTSSLAAGASENVTVSGTGKAGQLLAIEVDAPAWVVVYASNGARLADAGRTETTDPTPGSGVLAEIITTSADRILVTPCVNFFNDESTPVSELYLKVTNKDVTDAVIETTLTVMPTEA